MLEGGCAFEKAFGMTMWEYTVKNPEENKAFNEAMSSDTRAVMSSAIKIYEEGFKKITSLVDVGGGVGSALSIIAENYKHVIGIHFHLPHVIASAVPIPDFGKIDFEPGYFCLGWSGKKNRHEGQWQVVAKRRLLKAQTNRDNLML
ncbi:hypothetical protein SUGI_0488360 [Cryptomeria japonica]|nr:hypothetical protein SUGI_0488360 [Cryptomeria japonica]